MNSSNLRQKFDRFRILIIGRANAGKTTILQRVCNTQKRPEIYNSAGKKISAAILMPSRKASCTVTLLVTAAFGWQHGLTYSQRGLHDIENEMVFRSDPGFVFHDSRGFEAGGDSEFDKVKAFIANRSKGTDLKNRIHAIWYCIPMDESSRSFTESETKFFSQCDTGSVPVIVLFTKFDALYDVSYALLREDNKSLSMEDARALAPKHAEELFANGSQLKTLYNPKEITRPPRCHVCLPNMDKIDADCALLMKRTAETLDNEVLKQLFVSTQQVNLELCMKYAVERTLAGLVDSAESISSEILFSVRCQEEAIGNLGAWFPHIWLYGYHCGEIRSRILSVAPGLSPLENIVQFSSAAVIIFEHSFYLFYQQRYLRSVHPVRIALQRYMVSLHAAAVREAVSTAVRVYQGNPSIWKALLPFERSQRKSELIKRILEVILQHRLPRP
ncbi:hypothetical protein BDR05DRAFT_1063488 [Suillus weaverae]|nr:hypothetical protein BDR05DRAFT_1063488 [Suillus weaverae]